ncbi:unnamed protein product [Darwinula stevensoni]|uniref:Uncharacterized protein n=1 Tax=Darwinula stevensoni TaxID=69355 RepID=A0A7R9AGH6_9CRUS|nr:unnamed protein product [Darwinula stevensoni]CAG0903927.1 unnamed protein product [Darwinula stevensoni]
MSIGSERDNTDPCFPNPCGAHAKCRASGGHPVCTCIYYGNPETSCFEGECVETHDCSDDRVCKDFHCTDPCPETCGTGAQCIVRRHVPVCTCPAGHTGDPFERCRRLGPEELCDPSPCGRNSKCEVAFHLAICSCLPHFFGNPVQGCRAECETDSACAQTQECRLYKCVNPCTDACGENAECRVEHHRAICSCPKDFLGDPRIRCYAECTVHVECAYHQACVHFRCADPCVGACGMNAECRVENHKPICTCPKGFTGHPFDHCRPLNPVCGKKASQIQLSAGGNPSEIGEWPWQAAIYDIKKGDVICGGALIREEWVLTAAHCVVVDGSIRTRHSEEIFVYLGKHYRSYIKKDEHVSRIILHKEFNFYNNYDSDIALLKLRRPAVLTARVQLVCLPNRFDLSEAILDSGVPGWVAGWGYDGSDELAAVLTEVQLPVVSNRKCVRDTLNFTGDPGVTRTLTSNMFCAGFSADTPIEDFRTVCPGDSGSPMVFFSNTSQDSHWTMEGIVSHFFQKGACSMRRPGQYGIFTKVNRFTQWINRVIHSGF